MKLGKISKKIIAFGLMSYLGISNINCGKHHNPVQPVIPDNHQISVNVNHSLGDTLTTHDEYGREVSLMIPRGALVSDAQITLKQSDSDLESRLKNVKSGNVPFSFTMPDSLNDSIYVSMQFSGSNLVAISTQQDGYVRYEDYRINDGRVIVPLMKNSSVLTASSATSGEITTWVGDVKTQPVILDTKSVDLTQPDRPVVILIHGLAQDASAFEQSYNGLESIEQRILRDFPVMTFQYPSEKLPRDNAYALKQELAKLGEIKSPLYLLGYSMGGLVARNFVLFDDSTHLVKKVVFLGTPNNGVNIGLGNMKDYLSALLNSFGSKGNLIYTIGPGPRSLLRNPSLSDELSYLNRDRGNIPVKYAMMAADCESCPLDDHIDLSKLIPHNSDGIVDVPSVFMEIFPHETPSQSTWNLVIDTNHFDLLKNIIPPGSGGNSIGDLIVYHFKTN